MQHSAFHPVFPTLDLGMHRGDLAIRDAQRVVRLAPDRRGLQANRALHLCRERPAPRMLDIRRPFPPPRGAENMRWQVS